MWYEWSYLDFTERFRLLTTDLSHQFCKMLRHWLTERASPSAPIDQRRDYRQPVKLFVSHTKRDEEGKHIALAIREYIFCAKGLASFFDVYDISSGLEFDTEILENIRDCAVISVYSDKYSSREWCRREVLEAKKHHVPLVVANCLGESDERSFPYLGNVPVVRVDPKTADRVDIIIGTLLTEVLRDFLWQCWVATVEPYRLSNDVFVPRMPELLMLSEFNQAAELVLVYPEPVYPSRGSRAFRKSASYRAASKHVAMGRRAFTMTMFQLLKGARVAISVSDSPDLRDMGLASEHLQDAAVELARHFLALGAVLLYGGDLRPNGFTQALVDLAYRYRKTTELLSAEPILENLLAWPVHSSLESVELQECLNLDSRVVRTILLDTGGDEIDLPDFAERIISAPSTAEWSTGLASMRASATSRLSARLLLGGRVGGYKGSMPGLAQEALLCLKARKPIFVLGGFGGCAMDICESLRILPRRSEGRQWPGRSELEVFDDHCFNNGLTSAENRELAATRHIDEATVLVLRGLARIFSGSKF